MGETNSSVFGPQFCSPHPVELTIFGTCGIFTVSDAAAHVVKFRVVKIDSGLRQIWDADGNPIATLRRKRWTAHERWEVFRGDSKKGEDKVFSLMSPSIFTFKLNYHVFLAPNQQADDYEDCDFKVNGKWDQNKTLSIHAAQSPTNIISQVDQKQKAKTWDELEVKVEANMDQAFVVAVIIIIDAIYVVEPSAGAGAAAAAATASNAAAAAAASNAAAAAAAASNAAAAAAATTFYG